MLYRMTACALAVVAGTASAQTVGERSPAAEDMATLYIKTFINFDTGAVKQINNRLRSLYDGGEDSISVKSIESIEPENIADTAATLKQQAKVKNARLYSAIDGFSRNEEPAILGRRGIYREVVEVRLQPGRPRLYPVVME